MAPADLTSSLADLSLALSRYRGYRALWLDGRGGIVHSEPDDELGEQGLRYVGCVLNPSLEALTELLLPWLPLDHQAPPVRAPVGCRLAPALA